MIQQAGVVHAITAMRVQAGLLTYGSSYRLRLPVQLNSGSSQLSSPITAAGPSPICAGFPIEAVARINSTMADLFAQRPVRSY